MAKRKVSAAYYKSPAYTSTSTSTDETERERRKKKYGPIAPTEKSKAPFPLTLHGRIIGR